MAMGTDFACGPDNPHIGDWAEPSGCMGAYFHQDLLAARWIYDANPGRHVDVGSRLDGFIAHLAVFREVEVLDIRPQECHINRITFRQLDITRDLPDEWLAATDSLSCLHTIEHFGLGRYGDAIDPDGYGKGLGQLKRMVKPGGMLYLSTPIGPQRVEFNAHRVFAAATVIGWFAEGWQIEKFAVIDDDNRVDDAVDWKGSRVADHFGCRLGVGIVAARKLETVL